MTKEQLYAKVNAASSAADLDAAEQVAVEQGYSEGGQLRQTIASRRARFGNSSVARPAPGLGANGGGTVTPPRQDHHPKGRR